MTYNEYINISSKISVNDPDGDTITKYRVKDTVGWENNFYVNGIGGVHINNDLMDMSFLLTVKYSRII